MTAPLALVVAGFGLNCEVETAHAFEMAGAKARIVHLPDLAAAPETLRDAAILAVPGGFSFGDHLGAGNALASYLEARLKEAFADRIAGGGLVVGICNGCQTLVRLGLLGPGIAVARNAAGGEADGGYQCRWVRVRAPQTMTSPWFEGIDTLDLPVAHGEGRFVFAPGAEQTPALTYVDEAGAPAEGRFPANPNGASADAAGLLDTTGRVLALMPHPERYVRAEQHPNWTSIRERARRASAAEPREGDGLRLFRNAVAAV
ncbi:MAG: phosphoribosylformylglycinamidine synthase subunit PurQ [Pseudomonadota bacterium]